MRIRLTAMCCLCLVMGLNAAVAASSGDSSERYSVSNGSVSIAWDTQAMAEFGVTIDESSQRNSLLEVREDSSTFQLSRSNGHNEALFGILQSSGGVEWKLQRPDGKESVNVGDLHIGFGG